MRTAAILLTLGLSTSVLTPATAADAGPSTLIVGKDSESRRGFTPETDTIQKAVDKANAGDTIRVCPGLYRERVTVTKELKIRGPIEPVENLDCFTSDFTSLLSDKIFAIIEPPGAFSDSLVTLQANGIELSGLVVQKHLSPVRAYTIDNPVSDDPNHVLWIMEPAIQGE